MGPKCACFALLSLAGLLLSGCGTTSSFKPMQAANIQSIQKYTQVSVQDFANQTAGNAKEADAAKQQQVAEKIKAHGRHFADLIALELGKTKAFEKVDRGEKPAAGTLVVSGNITRCVEGNPSLRFWIGMGAGSSYFDALVLVSDADTGQQLGQFEVDKNSWALGGGLAADQTVQKFMEAAAKHVAAELSKAKFGKLASAGQP